MPAPLDKLAFRFFKLFAQYEYALKAMGYGRAVGRYCAAEADWDKFAVDIGSALLNDSDSSVVAARDFLFDSPPKRQVWIEDRVQWQDVANGERSSQLLFANIRRVRNNLYHGGKFAGEWFAPERSQQLILSSMVLLKRLMSLEPSLGEVIRGNSAWNPADDISDYPCLPSEQA